MMELIYLSDSYLYKYDKAVVIETESDDFGDFVVLNQTIFYPQGGGQPADNGVITVGQSKFSVSDVRLTSEGLVKHYGSSEDGVFNAGDSVEIQIDIERRILNSKLHSAGHLLDCAVAELELPIKPTKGFHFPVGTYVEYEGVLEEANQYKEPLEIIINRMVEEDVAVVVKELSGSDAEEQGIVAPEGKSARFVEFEGLVGCGCGGTHINSSRDLGKIIIRKLKSKKGNTKISYALEEYQV
jgi:Ser-tRNA(Ala) deacylase AlaX